jgi:hypothetical protein
MRLAVNPPKIRSELASAQLLIFLGWMEIAAQPGIHHVDAPQPSLTFTRVVAKEEQVSECGRARKIVCILVKQYIELKACNL